MTLARLQGQGFANSIYGQGLTSVAAKQLFYMTFVVIAVVSIA